MRARQWQLWLSMDIASIEAGEVERRRGQAGTSEGDGDQVVERIFDCSTITQDPRLSRRVGHVHVDAACTEPYIYVPAPPSPQ